MHSDDRTLPPSHRFGVYKFVEDEYRKYFKSEEAFRIAMDKARMLERKNCPNRAWRVRLNLDEV